MTERAQSNLPALATALLLVGASVGLAVGVAAGAFAGADTDPADARLAASLSERLVSPDGPLSARANVLSAAAVANASASADWLPEDAAVRVTLDGEAVVSRGDAGRGATIRRVVLVADSERRTLEPTFAGRNAVTLPRRTANATLTFDPAPATRITTVRANGRVVLRDPDGLDGAYDVALSRYDTVELTFDANRDLAPGSVRVAYRAEVTTKAVLGVTVDA
ncbi:DUF7263 family protein [Halobacterium litoreum]|uniref:Uncharacterized protein n=1 Tax=Halobacterium litoreum TaxID=2039234 RepID=A0ABD5NG61_9EURY|nr:hypothetical protein [Halobacterium litoreum]UHH12824.1 hypothetical protein LT972_11730 [Halobacterium litoreum]